MRKSFVTHLVGRIEELHLAAKRLDPQTNSPARAYSSSLQYRVPYARLNTCVETWPVDHQTVPFTCREAPLVLRCRSPWVVTERVTGTANPCGVDRTARGAAH